MFVLDTHCDTPSKILEGRDLLIDSSISHVDYPKLKRGGVDGAFFALYVPCEYDETPELGYQYAMGLLAGIENSVESNPTLAAFAFSRESALENRSKGLFSIFLGLENASPVYNIGKLKELYDRGIRYITLCHASNNAICDSCASESKKWGGLSPYGREVIAEMNRLGMLIDVSHVSDDTFYDVLQYSERPVVATHSCCRALCNHPRNMSDDMIRALADAGGVIQINFYPVFLSQSCEASYKDIADHIDHVVDLVGIEHVGIGSDFDGIEITPKGLEDISGMPVIFDELRARGYSKTDIEKIASENFFNVLSSCGGER